MDLCLATVGVSMRLGSGAKRTAAEIMDEAKTSGVTAIDTSGAYGEAEKVIGSYLESRGSNEFETTIKIKPGALFNVAPQNYYDTLKGHAMGSLNNLKIKRAGCCMFHNAEYIDNKEAISALNRLKNERLFDKTGICISLPSEFTKASNMEEFDVISIPYNILDTRLDGLLKKTQKEIHARGAFLNGVLLMDAGDVAQELWGIKPYLRRIDSFCEYNGVKRLDVIIGFIKTQPKIDRLIIDVEDPELLDEIYKSFASPCDTGALRELVEEFSGVAESVIMPSLWHGEYK